MCGRIPSGVRDAGGAMDGKRRHFMRLFLCPWAHVPARATCGALAVAVWLTAAALVPASCGGEEGGGASSSPTASASVRSGDASPSVSPSPTGVTAVGVGGDLAVVRPENGRWTVWRVTPATGAAKRVVGLPFEPAAAAGSPDGRYVAYLASWAKQRGWRRTLAVIDVAGGVAWPTLRGTGLRLVNDMTWLSPTELVVSGPVPKGHNSPQDDRLYVYDVRADSFSRFHDIAGTEPSASVRTGAVAFRRVTQLGDGLVPDVLDQLRLWRDGAEAGDPVVSETRSWDTPWSVSAEPVLSPDGRYVLAAETGSDSGVRWSLYRTQDAASLWTRNEWTAHPLVGAWDPQGRRLSFWGVPATRWGRTTVWVYDVETDRFRTSLAKRGERVVEGYVTGLDWSNGGNLAASTAENRERRVLVAPGGDPKAFTVLCAGDLPVWLD